MSPHGIDTMDSHDNTRKRVCKACDRCRLKKSKCDGSSPCSRCKADNAICVFGERKRSQDKVYPKGYVEMLEQQQSQLVAGLREMYNRMQKGEGWPGAPLREVHGGAPLTHDILERLDLLHSSGDGNSSDEFEEDTNRMQQKLLDGGARLARRRSMSSESVHGHASSPSSYSGTPVTTSTPTFAVPTQRMATPPTPPLLSPFSQQSQMIAPIKQERPLAQSSFLQTGALDPSSLSQGSWPPDPMMMSEPLDFNKAVYGFDSFGTFNRTMMMRDPLVINDPVMSDWNSAGDLDFTNFANNHMIA